MVIPPVSAPPILPTLHSVCYCLGDRLPPLFFFSQLMNLGCV